MGFVGLNNNEIDVLAGAPFNMENDVKEAGWFARNWKWFIPVTALALVVLIVASTVTAYVAIKSTEVYTEAVKMTLENDQAREALGGPSFEADWLIAGSVNINETDQSGSADIAIPVSGSRNSGVIQVAAKRSAGQWQFSS